jgi:hypothetical protein
MIFLCSWLVTINPVRPAYGHLPKIMVLGAKAVVSYKLQCSVIYLLICSQRNWFDRHNTNIHALTTTADYLLANFNGLDQPHSTLVSIPTCYRLRAGVLSFAQTYNAPKPPLITPLAMSYRCFCSTPPCWTNFPPYRGTVST